MSTKLSFTYANQDKSCHGLLSEHIDDFVADLFQKGYSHSTVREKIRLLSALSRWLEKRAVPTSRYQSWRKSQLCLHSRIKVMSESHQGTHRFAIGL